MSIDGTYTYSGVRVGGGGGGEKAVHVSIDGTYTYSGVRVTAVPLACDVCEVQSVLCWPSLWPTHTPYATVRVRERGGEGRRWWTSK